MMNKCDKLMSSTSINCISCSRCGEEAVSDDEDEDKEPESVGGENVDKDFDGDDGIEFNEGTESLVGELVWDFLK
jgi:hypothetical protein